MTCVGYKLENCELLTESSESTVCLYKFNIINYNNNLYIYIFEKEMDIQPTFNTDTLEVYSILLFNVQIVSFSIINSCTQYHVQNLLKYNVINTN